MLLQYDRLTIRNAEPADGALLAAWWNDGNIMSHAGFPNGLGRAAETIAKDLAGDTDETRRRLIIELDTVPIGEMNYRNNGGSTAEIGIKICDFSKQEKGLGKILLSMLIASLFQNGYQRIVLDTNLNNTRAQHVYERLGFRKTGVRINSWTNQLGQPQSAVDYELIPEDFVDFTKVTGT